MFHCLERIDKPARDKMRHEDMEIRNIRFFCKDSSIQKTMAVMAVTVAAFFAASITISAEIAHTAEAIPIPENFSATISNESQDIEASVNNDLKQAQQLMASGNTTGAIQEIIDAVSLLSSARQDVGP